jgi:F-type H+-transporting ATPase subunit b
MRKVSATLLLVLGLAPATAKADTMPQMDFANPLTLSQVGWMAVILVVLYLLLSRWGLPEIGKVLEHREKVIAADLAAARAAKQQADAAVATLNATIAQARSAAQAEVTQAVANAKADALKQAAELNAALDAKLEEAEAQIDAARAAALAAIKPVAAEAASAIIVKLTGAAPGADTLAPRLDAALAQRKVA